MPGMKAYLDAARKRIFDKNQRELPEQMRCCEPHCCAMSNDGFICTCIYDHEGSHVAHGALGNALRVWCS